MCFILDVLYTQDEFQFPTASRRVKGQLYNLQRYTKDIKPLYLVLQSLLSTCVLSLLELAVLPGYIDTVYLICVFGLRVAYESLEQVRGKDESMLI